MRDIAVMLFVFACIGLVIRKPWTGVLVLANFSYMSPHLYAWGFTRSFPVYLLLFMVVFLTFLIKGAKERQAIPNDWRVPTFFFLWFWFLVTTLDSLLPKDAWPKLTEVSKIYLPLILTLWMIDTRDKLFYLIATIAASIGLIAVKGGIWALSTGFAHRVYGPPGSQYGNNNEFAIACLTVIPLIVLWLRETTNKNLKIALTIAVPLCFAAALSSHSRGALVAMGLLVPILLWHSRRKWLAVPVLVLGVVLALQYLPEHWFSRMETIETYEEDASAMGRILAWRDGIAYAFSNPITGGGFNGWIWITKRDWHSSYVEALAEHGFVGFLLWFALLFGTMLSLTRLPRLVRRIPEMKWVANYAYMLRASLAAYAAGALFLGITYWDLLYQLIFISVLVKKFAMDELAEYQASRAVAHRAPGALPGRPGSNQIPAAANRPGDAFPSSS